MDKKGWFLGLRPGVWMMITAICMSAVVFQVFFSVTSDEEESTKLPQKGVQIIEVAPLEPVVPAEDEDVANEQQELTPSQLALERLGFSLEGGHKIIITN